MRSNLPPLDGSAIVSGLFLPLLAWTGSVLVISLVGYPGVICLTPLAWLLALPLGLRVRRESHSQGRLPLAEAALGGAVLGIWQGALLAAVLAFAPFLSAQGPTLPPSPLFGALLGILISTPVTTGLAALAARTAR